MNLRIALFAASVVFASSDQTPPNAQQPVLAWQSDIDYALSELELRHANLHHSATRETLIAASAAAKKTAVVTRAEAAVALARLLARIGDGHTGVFLPWDRQNGFRTYPFEVHARFGEVFVLAAPQELREIVGARLLRVGGRPLDEVIEAIAPLVPLDNPYGLAAMLPSYLRLAELLHVLGISASPDEVALSVRTASGEDRTVTVRATAAGDAGHLLLQAGDNLPHWLRHRDKAYWMTELTDLRAVYVQYNDASFDDPAEPLAIFCRKLSAALAAPGVEKLIIDLRWNDGGSINRLQQLLQVIIREPKINHVGRFFAIVGPTTFSAAVLFSVDLERLTPVLFVGEPTGGRPNSYGDGRRFRLPQSGLEVRYASTFHQRSGPFDTRPAIEPQLQARVTWADYLAGRDPALDAIARYQPKLPIADVLKPLLLAGDATSAERYDELRKRRFNEYDFSEAALSALVRELAGGGHAEAALRVASWNLDANPHSAAAHADLAAACEKLGLRARARAHYRRAFEINKAYAGALEAARRLQ